MARKNQRIGLIVIAVVLAMVCMAYASVPLYSLFCRVTGFGGTTQTAAAFPDAKDVVDRTITIRFNTQTSPNLLWEFEPEVPQIKVKIGEKGLATFKAHNYGQVPVAGTALYNVTPLKVGKYFNKVQCFCFNEQILQPGQRATMPVLFYVDPQLAQDPNMSDVTTITLSYTFFKTESDELDKAMEDFYNKPGGDI